MIDEQLQQKLAKEKLSALEAERKQCDAAPRYGFPSAGFSPAFDPGKCGSVKQAETSPSQSFRDMLHYRIASAQNESRKLSRLTELRDLLDCNPEVARILELMEEFKNSH